ncbi:hypothetical protein R5R35_011238 [Gryllus longicercus]|uniref:PPIase cyclophilin-type domain-containing protein n=1 Tax=Gryllus longicercus TaxID=2509291 RepID=A0AAN9VY31_9ORTH
MDFRVGELPIGSMMFELFTELAPMMCRNFMLLCTGEGLPNEKGEKFCYKGTRIHRIVKDGWIQCGGLC